MPKRCAAPAKKFGAKIVEERVYEDTGGGRRSDSGSVQTQRLIPVATQNAPAYDVLVAADESEVFANYLPFRTWDARPVAGSAGLEPMSWDGTHEQWGAIQLQNRFMKLASRRMNARDNNAWVAMRMIGEAATRTGSNDPKIIRDYLTGPEFAIAAFKGQKQTLAPLEPAIAPAYPAWGWTHDCLGFAAGRLSPSNLRTRYAWLRPAGNKMQIAMKISGKVRVRRRRVPALRAPCAGPRHAGSRFGVYRLCLK